jgi:hypothetical protein
LIVTIKQARKDLFPEEDEDEYEEGEVKVAKPRVEPISQSPPENVKNRWAYGMPIISFSSKSITLSPFSPFIFII